MAAFNFLSMDWGSACSDRILGSSHQPGDSSPEVAMQLKLVLLA